MKTKITLLGFFISLIIFSSCSTQETTEKDSSVYACPMKCEGEKTHSEKGSCSICKMDLTAVE